jgi:hypothetical protein
MQSFKQFYIEQQLQQNKQSKLDTLQSALDIAGFEPSVGTAADATNTVISGLRAALAKEPDQRKKHLINAGISAISMVPFADVIKLLKIRKLGKPATQLAAQGARDIKTWGKQQQATNRFEDATIPPNIRQKLQKIAQGTYTESKKEKRRLDPKCWKGYRKAGTKLKDGTRVNKCVKVNK